MRHVLFFALSTDDPDEGGCKEDTLGLYNMVCGLVEGCWDGEGFDAVGSGYLSTNLCKFVSIVKN